MEDEEEGVILMSSLPNEIAILCLARLPPRSRARARCVSRAWRTALTNCSSVHRLRTSLNLPPEYWVFVGVFDTDFDGGYVRATHHNTKWLLLDPLTLGALPLPNPLTSGISIDIRLRSAATNYKLFLPEIRSEKMGFWCYDMQERGGEYKSIPLPPPVKEQHCKRFACSGDKQFMYIAGGQLEVNREACRRACRYDTLTKRWEMLPCMVLPRINSAGVVMNGKFMSIGGYHVSAEGFAETHASAEVFYPETWEWRLLPNFCASGLRYAENSDVEEAAVAVVENNMYAMQSHCNEVMHFDWAKEQWAHFGYVGGEYESGNKGASYRLMGVGSEMWAIKQATGMSISIHACHVDRRESHRAKWTKIKVPQMERFHHLLTCTVVKPGK